MCGSSAEDLLQERCRSLVDPKIWKMACFPQRTASWEHRRASRFSQTFGFHLVWVRKPQDFPQFITEQLLVFTLDWVVVTQMRMRVSSEPGSSEGLRDFSSPPSPPAYSLGINLQFKHFYISIKGLFLYRHVLNDYQNFPALTCRFFWRNVPKNYKRKRN